MLPETLCLHVQMGPYQRERQAPHAQPSHQQGQWTPDTHKDLKVKPEKCLLLTISKAISIFFF